MKRRLTAAAAALLGIVLLTSCGNPKEFSDGERLSAGYERNSDTSVTCQYVNAATEAPKSYHNYAIGAAAFSLSQLRARAAENTGSFVFSPAAVTLQLGLAANAASSDMRQELLLALGSTMTLDDVNACSSYFKSRMETVSKTGQAKAPAEQIKLGGAMLVNQDTDVKTAFLQSNADFYGYDVFRYDFSDENAADKLNHYLKPYTGNSAVDVTAGGSLYAVTTSEVIDRWLVPYAENTATAGSFNGANGARNTVFLRSDETVVQSKKATGVLKYTEKNPLRLLLILPDSKLGLEDYLASFDPSELSALLDSVDVTKRSPALIPEMTVESDGKGVPLSASLAKSGLYSMFSDKAGFSLGYSKTTKAGEMFEIPPAFSLTAAGINCKAETASAPVTAEAPKDALIFDRPFLFMLLDNETDIPVLAGVYR